MVSFAQRNELRLRRFRNFACTNLTFLAIATPVSGLLALDAFGRVFFKGISIPFVLVYGSVLIWTAFLLGYLIWPRGNNRMGFRKVPLGFYFLGVDNMGDANMGGANLANLSALRKESTKELALAFFTILDSPLKEKNGRDVIVFCSAFYLHLVHVMVVFGISEDFDFAGGFLGASFGLVFEKCDWPQVFLLAAVAALMASYKGLLLVGVQALGLSR